MEALFEEADALEAILMDDVKIVRHPDSEAPELIETVVLPLTGDGDNEQYVCVTLQVFPTPNYPDERPIINLKNPRGLCEQSLTIIRQAIDEKLDSSLGFPVVFDLIDIIREHLTDSNVPSDQCVVCLYGFQEGDAFTKTVCYHYLHNYCLYRHLNASRKNFDEEFNKLPGWQQKDAKPFQPTCPVCRENIDNEADTLANSKPPVDVENAPVFHLTDDLKQLQVKMANLFLHQKSRGGIIDLEAAEANIISLGAEEEPEPSRPQPQPVQNNSLPNSANKTNRASASKPSAKGNEPVNGNSATSSKNESPEHQPMVNKRHAKRNGGNWHKSNRHARQIEKHMGTGASEQSSLATVKR